MSTSHQAPCAIVTGASRGIGKAIALALAREGYDLVINYARNVEAAKDVESQITGAGRRALLVRADVSIAADRQRLVDETYGAFGGVDLLVNNAGVAPEVRADLLDASEESFDRLINNNLKGPFFLTQAVARKMMSGPERAQPPRIVNITSVSAFTASTNRGDYCIAKAGLAMMTKLFAVRLAEHGINVYEIQPGIIETDMTGPVKSKYDKLILEQDLTPIKRWGATEDVAQAVVAIARGMLPFSTGEVIHVDGGFHLRRL